MESKFGWHSGLPSPFSAGAQRHKPTLGAEGSAIAATEAEVTATLPHLLRTTIPVRQSLACATDAMHAVWVCFFFFFFFFFFSSSFSLSFSF
jgi:hypothetical protein